MDARSFPQRPPIVQSCAHAHYPSHLTTLLLWSRNGSQLLGWQSRGTSDFSKIRFRWLRFQTRAVATFHVSKQNGWAHFSRFKTQGTTRQHVRRFQTRDAASFALHKRRLKIWSSHSSETLKSYRMEQETQRNESEEQKDGWVIKQSTCKIFLDTATTRVATAWL